MKFTEEHEWLVKEENHVIVGITEHEIGRASCRERV